MKLMNPTHAFCTPQFVPSHTIYAGSPVVRFRRGSLKSALSCAEPNTSNVGTGAGNPLTVTEPMARRQVGRTRSSNL